MAGKRSEKRGKRDKRGKWRGERGSGFLEEGWREEEKEKEIEEKKSMGRRTRKGKKERVMSIK